MACPRCRSMPMAVSGFVVGLLIVSTSAVFPVVVSRHAHLRTATNYHISVLCVSDCVVGLTLVLYPTVRILWPELGLSAGLCVTVLSISSVCFTVSNGVMFWLALDRRTAIHHPLVYPLLVTASTVRWELLLTGPPALLLVVFTLATRQLSEPPLPDIIPKCFTAWHLVVGDGAFLLNGVNLLVIGATLALSVDVLLEARRVLRAAVVPLPHQMAERVCLRQHVRTFYYLLRVLVLYGVCLIPYSVYALVMAWWDVPLSTDRSERLWNAFMVLRAVFNLADSWVYCSNPELRQAILHLCCRSQFGLYP
ncbi:hypothetical protein FJT64_021825 [Amphibalanus amphitrite]|uniref:G-protein coupled receptors family 1 profile domain-containing protein n=1 Tax=Amphibalanus amphitrite TaxID=1232801 RepID=A0A6A4WN47_AMPAM|nr:hypothetical protein FJT64_021825 [Amphibalanus amphitrite]